MTLSTVSRDLPNVEPTNPALLAIVRHLWEGDCHAYGAVLEGCDSRGDCCYAVVCPTCRTQFVIDEDDLVELRRWTEARGTALACGVRWE